jgi:predicted nuclease of predicted toxin-antitoxin system
VRFLANENFPLDAVTALRQIGHDVAWIRTDNPGCTDQEVLARAVAEDRILLTFDKDFGELAFRSKLPASCGIILIRATAPSSEYLARLVVSVMQTDTELTGNFVVVEKSRLRIRPLPGY